MKNMNIKWIGVYVNHTVKISRTVTRKIYYLEGKLSQQMFKVYS